MGSTSTPVLFAFAMSACLAMPAAAPAQTPPEAGVGGDAAARPVEATSLLGVPLLRPALAPETRTRLEADLARARQELDASPEDADALIWVGRRLAYLGRYRDAIDVFTRGVEVHPEDARFLRHRGHRWITVRELDRAEEDLARAAEMIRATPDEVEPDGAPNPAGIPTSTLQSNIWYHLGLARYLKGDYEGALDAYRECLAVSGNPDMLVATTDWLWMTLHRLGRDAEAAVALRPIHADMEILENHAYHRRLLLYRGELTPGQVLDDDAADGVQWATQGYGVGNWHLVEGRREEAVRIFRRILESESWAAFGYIAAEADLARGVGRGERAEETRRR